MLKVLFYHANDTLTHSHETVLFLGIAALCLRTHIETSHPEIGNQIEWLLPIQNRLTDQELIDYCNEVKPDLICTSHYIWNHTFLMEQLERLQSKISSNIKFAVGGPSIDVNIDPEFFKKYSFVDYAVYGAGEHAFADILSSVILNKPLIAFNTSNIAWFDKQKNKTVIADFKYVPQSKISPFLHCEEMFSDMVKDQQNKNISVIIPYDLTRGCPYSCTFCDWNSGLTNKVSRRKGSYRDEIDLFQKLKIRNIYLSDANVGQYQEDIDMIAYFAEKNINEGAKFVLDGNYSKLRKENNLKIYHLLGKANLASEYAGFTISVQDINPQVLQNIDRPDVGWSEHLAIITELKEAFPERHSKIQLIQGLPGQTPDSWRATLAEISKYEVQLQPFISELLPASPAARDKEYQEKFKFTYSTSQRYQDGYIFRGTFPESCVSFTKFDFVKMTILTIFYSALIQFKIQSKEEFDFENVVDEFLMSKNYFALENNLYNNWTMHDKFYFSLDLDLNARDVSACQFIISSNDWSRSLFLLKLIASNVKGSPMTLVKRMLNYKNGVHQVKIRSLEGYT